MIRTLVTATFLVACSPQGTGVTPPDESVPAEVRTPTAIAFVDVTVVPMTGTATLASRTVVVRDGRVERIDPAGATLPPDAVVINGAGRFLAPSLIDMHVHLRSAHLMQYLRAGIGTVRNMWGHSGIRGMAQSIESGSRLGPTVFSVGPGLDGPNPQWPETQIVRSTADVVHVIDSLTNYGWRTMKIYQSLTLQNYTDIMSEVKRRGIDAVGHVPTAVTIHQALAAGQRSIEHLAGYDRAVSRRGFGGTFGWSDADESRYASLVAASVAAGTWNCPTMAIIAALAAQHSPGERTEIVTNRRRFLRALSSGGARVLVGTDAGIDVVEPGTSIHDELGEFVAAGLTPYAALRAATVDAAEFLGVPQLGTITVGAPAQLMLLDANPLTDVRNARRLRGLVLRGEWFSAARLMAP